MDENAVLQEIGKLFSSLGLGSLFSRYWKQRHEGYLKNQISYDSKLIKAQAETDIEDIKNGNKRYDPKKHKLLDCSPNSRTKTKKVQQKERIEPTIDLIIQDLEYSDKIKRVIQEVNVTNAMIHAVEILSASDNKIFSTESISKDWLFAWYEYAGKISTEELQEFWGKILAGEIQSPNSCSIRVLDFLRTISKDEAEKIAKVASFLLIEKSGSLVTHTGGILYKSGAIAKCLEDNGITQELLLEIEELGLILGVGQLGLITEFASLSSDNFFNQLHSNERLLVIENDDSNKKFSLDCYPLTPMGKRVFNIGNFQSNNEYLELVKDEITKKGFTVELKMQTN